MRSIHFAWRAGSVALILLATIATVREAKAESEFPFGMEMTLDALPQRGSKRVPDLDIGDNGEVVLELWCKGGKGQFSVAGDTVIFVAGPMEDRSCPPDKAQADDDLVAALTEATTWRRQGDAVSFIGTRTLKFHINSN
jgi:META domain-containing protein